MLELYFTTRFKKDYKAMIRRGAKAELIEKVIEMLRLQHALPEKTGIMS